MVVKLHNLATVTVVIYWSLLRVVLSSLLYESIDWASLKWSGEYNVQEALSHYCQSTRISWRQHDWGWPWVFFIVLSCNIPHPLVDAKPHTRSGPKLWNWKNLIWMQNKHKIWIWNNKTWNIKWCINEKINNSFKTISELKLYLKLN